MNQYNTYLFDLDGTLIDTTEMILRCFQHTLKPYENETVKVVRKEILSSIGRPFTHQLDIFFESNGLPKPNYQSLGEIHMEFQGRIWKEYLRVFEEIPKVLTSLKEKGAKLAIVTSRKQPSAITFMKHVKILHFFDLLVTPESTKQHKPHPEPAQFAIENLNSKVEESIFIGDSRFDIECAASAGLHSYLVQRSEGGVVWNVGEDENEARPTYVFPTLTPLTS